jgi:hypothetical protein
MVDVDNQRRRAEWAATIAPTLNENKQVHVWRTVGGRLTGVHNMLRYLHWTQTVATNLMDTITDEDIMGKLSECRKWLCSNEDIAEAIYYL